MTEQEKKIKRYVNDVERRLRLPLREKARINGDLGSDIHARLEAGDDIDTVLADLGAPADVAESFNRELGAPQKPRGSVWRWLFLLLAVCGLWWGLHSFLPALWVLPTALRISSMGSMTSSIGVIGGADGPTTILVAGKLGMSTQCFGPALALGCLSAFLLLRPTGGKTRLRWAIGLSIGGMVLWAAAMALIVLLGQCFAQAPEILVVLSLPTEWSAGTLLLCLATPGFWLPIATLVIAVQRLRQMNNA